MPRRSLKKIPIKKYKKGDPYDMCAVCLEDYNEGERLRVLPCAHGEWCQLYSLLYILGLSFLKRILLPVAYYFERSLMFGKC